MTKYIKNADTITRTWCGQEIASSAYYLLQCSEESQWANDSSVFDSIADDTIIVSKTNESSGHITDHALAINYLKDNLTEIDSQGRQIIRTAAGKKGWTYLGLAIELETAKASSLFCKDENDNNIAGISLKYYKSDGTEITTQGDLDSYCVKTVLTIAPDHDYELMGGNIHHDTVPISDVRLWVKGGILELGSNYTKTMINGINMLYLGVDDHIRTDGRASKYMTKTIAGVPYQGNQLQMIIKHDAGYKHKIMFVLEYFRA